MAGCVHNVNRANGANSCSSSRFGGGCAGCARNQGRFAGNGRIAAPSFRSGSCCSGNGRIVCGNSGANAARTAAATAARARSATGQRCHKGCGNCSGCANCGCATGETAAGANIYGGGGSAEVMTTCCDPCGGCREFSVAARDPFWPTFARPRWLSCDQLYCQCFR